MTKRCSKYGKKKKLEEFSEDLSGKNGKYSRCKKCKANYSKIYYKNHKKEANKKVVEWRTNNREKYNEWMKNTNKKQRDNLTDYYIKRNLYARN